MVNDILLLPSSVSAATGVSLPVLLLLVDKVLLVPSAAVASDIRLIIASIDSIMPRFSLCTSLGRTKVHIGETGSWSIL